MSEKIKFTKRENNAYLMTEEGIWVRDFTKSNTKFLDINSLYSEKDYSLFLSNEIENTGKRLAFIDQDIFTHPNIVIVSDGYDFSNKQHILSKLPKYVAIIGVNRALAKWKLVGANCPQELKRSMSWYVINNPYPESIKFLPTSHRYFPRCISSVRTNPEFTRKYEGNIVMYTPTSGKMFSGMVEHTQYCVDDYRNPICAAINLAYRFKVQKLLLFCCDDSFSDERPGSVQLQNGLYSYPQQQVSRHVIDANLYWMKKENIKIGDYSKGIILQHSLYISTEREVLDFFKEDDV
jgi:hypothetical protein